MLLLMMMMMMMMSMMRRVHYVGGDGSKHCDIVKYDNQIAVMHNMVLRLKKKMY